MITDRDNCPSPAEQTELLSPRLWMLLCLGDEEGDPAAPQRRCAPAGFHSELAAEELRQFLRASSQPGWVRSLSREGTCILS